MSDLPVDSPLSSTQPLATTPALRDAAVRLRRWSRITGALLAIFLVLWGMMLAAVVVRLAGMAVQQMPLGASFGFLSRVFAFTLGVGVTFGFPSWFALAAAKNASRAIATDTVAPLVRSLVWSRRFLIVVQLWLAGYLLVVGFLYGIDFIGR